MRDCERSKASTLSISVYGCAHSEYPRMTGPWERVAILVWVLHYARFHTSDATLSMCIVNLVRTPFFTAKVTKVYTAATPSGGWVDAVLPSPAGGLSQVADAYFYSGPVCLDLSELLL